MTSPVYVPRALVAALLALVPISCGPSKPVAEAAPAPDTPEQVAAAPSTAPGPANPTSRIEDLLDATVVHWNVVGDFAGEVTVLKVGIRGFAEVTDHIEFAFDYTMEGNTGVIGTPTFSNFPTVMGAQRTTEPGCPLAQLEGPYEYWTIETVEPGIGSAIALNVRTDYPGGKVGAVCDGLMESAAPHTETDHVELAIPGVALLMMGNQLTGDLQLSADKRSIIVKDGS